MSEQAEKGEWPGTELPESWSWASFHDAWSDSTDSTRKLKQKEYRAEGPLPVVDQGESLVGGFTDRHDLKNDVPLPCIVFGDHTRAVKFIGFEFAQGADGVKVLRPNDQYDPEFAYQALRCVRLPNKGYSRHFKFLKSTSFPIPPLPEQRRIVAKLDRLSARSAAARDHLARTTKLATRAKHAILTEAFDGRLTEEWRSASGAQFPWPQKCIGEIAHIVTGNTPLTKNKANYGDEHPFVKPGDLDKGAIYATESYLSSDGYSIARQLPIDTVLVSCIGNLGKIGILARNGSCNQQINALLPSADLLPRFTYWWAHTIRPWLEENSSATTVSIINKGRFSLAPISVPGIEEQAEIVRRIEAAFNRIDSLTKEASRAAHLLDRLDERLLAKAFRGELVPQNPEDEPAETLLTRIREARAAAPKAKRGAQGKALKE